MGVELCIEMPVMTFSPFGNTKLFGNKRPRQGKKAAEICETFGMDPSGIEELRQRHLRNIFSVIE